MRNKKHEIDKKNVLIPVGIMAVMLIVLLFGKIFLITLLIKVGLTGLVVGFVLFLMSLLDEFEAKRGEIRLRKQHIKE